jgi:hypothetical protein
VKREPIASRIAIDINRVNIDDLLVTRPGGIIRVDGDPNKAIMQLPFEAVWSWDCAHCQTRIMWRDGDRIPSKCYSCGAPPKADNA